MKRLWLTRKWLVGLAVLVVLVVGGGTAVMAASGDGPANTYTGVYFDSPTVERLAGALGLTPEELTGQLQTGKTLATIALELNIPAASLTEAITAPYAEHIALQVKYGYITQEQADARLETARQRAATLLEQDLSSTGSNAGWQQQMADNCANAMNNSDGATGTGGMMGGTGSGMMGGTGSGMMSGTGSGMMSGGRMGGGMMSGGMMGR